MFSAARRTIENAHQDDTTKRDGGANLLRRPFDVSRTHMYHHHRCGITADPFIDTSIEFYLTKK